MATQNPAPGETVIAPAPTGIVAPAATLLGPDGRELKFGETIRKSFKASMEVKDGENAVIATVSTDALDRDREVVLPRGIELATYRKNPVVLWAHDYTQPPIGKCLWIKLSKDRRRLIAKTQFNQTPMGQMVFDLYRKGHLSAFSIGFQVMDASPPEVKEMEERPELEKCWIVIRSSSLLEYSCVPIPANPEALALAVSKGMKVPDELKKSVLSAPYEICFHEGDLEEPTAEDETTTVGSEVIELDVEAEKAAAEAAAKQAAATTPAGDEVVADAAAATLPDAAVKAAVPFEPATAEAVEADWTAGRTVKLRTPGGYTIVVEKFAADGYEYAQVLDVDGQWVFAGSAGMLHKSPLEALPPGFDAFLRPTLSKAAAAHLAATKGKPCDKDDEEEEEKGKGKPCDKEDEADEEMGKGKPCDKDDEDEDAKGKGKPKPHPIDPDNDRDEVDDPEDEEPAKPVDGDSDGDDKPDGMPPKKPPKKAASSARADDEAEQEQDAGKGKGKDEGVVDTGESNKPPKEGEDEDGDEQGPDRPGDKPKKGPRASTAEEEAAAAAEAQAEDEDGQGNVPKKDAKALSEDDDPELVKPPGRKDDDDDDDDKGKGKPKPKKDEDEEEEEAKDATTAQTSEATPTVGDQPTSGDRYLEHEEAPGVPKPAKQAAEAAPTLIRYRTRKEFERAFQKALDAIDWDAIVKELIEDALDKHRGIVR